MTHLGAPSQADSMSGLQGELLEPLRGWQGASQATVETNNAGVAISA